MFTIEELFENRLEKGAKIIIPVIKSNKKSESKIKELAKNSTDETIKKFKNKGNKKNGMVKKIYTENSNK